MLYTQNKMGAWGFGIKMNKIHCGISLSVISINRDASATFIFIIILIKNVQWIS